MERAEISTKLEKVNYQISQNERAGQPVEDLRKEQEKLQKKIKENYFLKPHLL